MVDERFEVFETCCNDMQLQASWAMQNQCGNLALQDDSEFKIIEAQIKRIQPDILFLYAGAGFIVTRHVRERIRRIAPSDMSIAVYWGDEIPPGRSYADYFGDMDIAFCSSPIYQKHFADAGIEAVIIGNAFDPSIRYDAPSQKKHDFVFCGTAGFGIPEHLKRFQVLRYLLANTALQIYTNERPHWRKPASLRSRVRELILAVAEKLPIPVLSICRRWPRITRLMDLARQAKQAGVSVKTLLIPAGEHPMLYVFNNEKPLQTQFPGRLKKQKTSSRDYFNLIAESKLVLNIHRDENADIGNIRCFEVTGVGSCLITDWREGLSDLFDVENDIVTFTTAQECAEKVRYLLAHPDEMERIARNGQRTTLARHTVAERCKKIAATLRGGNRTPRQIKRRVVVATYDLEHHPLSYDIAFFVQAAEIYRQQTGCDNIALTIAAPKDIDNQAGVSKEVYSVVDGRAREYRINHICVEMAQLMPSIASIVVKYRAARDFAFELEQFDAVPYPNGQPHHNEYYQVLNQHPDLVSGFSSTTEAQRVVRKWLDPVSGGRKVVCVSLRQYLVDTGRNSNIPEWAAFLQRLDQTEYAVVVLPDTDHIADFKSSPLAIYPAFEPACFGVDLRMALYESAYLNMFVSNGPSFAATLFRNVNYLMFKIMQPDIPLVAPEVLTWLGYEIGGTPKYATPFQKWVWEQDAADVLHREFVQMDRLLRDRTM